MKFLILIKKKKHFLKNKKSSNILNSHFNLQNNFLSFSTFKMAYTVQENAKPETLEYKVYFFGKNSVWIFKRA